MRRSFRRSTSSRAEAPAQHRDPGERRHAAGQPRRDRRPGGLHQGIAALPAPGLRGDRGPALLPAFRVDPVGILRAVGQNLTRRGVAQGGSTLTQQLAKNLFLTPERSASRKIQEAILALWLEHKYTKDEILELYLNRVYFGAGAYGVEAAAQRYFGKPAKEVSLAQAAMLGGLVQAPSRLAPNRNLPAAQARAAQVLAAMQELGFATAQDVKVALAQPARPANARAAARPTTSPTS